MKIETPSQRKLALLYLALCAAFAFPLLGLVMFQ